MKTLRWAALPLLLMTVRVGVAPGQQNPAGQLLVTTTPPPLRLPHPRSRGPCRTPSNITAARGNRRPERGTRSRALVHAEPGSGLHGTADAGNDRNCQGTDGGYPESRSAGSPEPDRVVGAGHEGVYGDDLPARLQLAEGRRQAIRRGSRRQTRPPPNWASRLPMARM